MSLLGGSWVVISRVISHLIWVISIVTLLITLLITTPEPPRKSKKHIKAVLAMLSWMIICVGTVQALKIYVNKILLSPMGIM